MKHKGSISINRCSTNAGYVCRIEINDEVSQSRIIDVELDFKAFGNAVTGLSSQPVTFTIGRPENVGKKRQTKREWILVNDPEVLWYATDENIAKLKGLAAPFEVDGWAAMIEDVFFCHKKTVVVNGETKVAVTFIRYVDLETDK